ncbi:hypothetical protein QZH41_001332 [Actinostola sp. cb2023]|nr:hypothetical protein QZH41_001332 [Actinostola sp. cb2023]
MKVICAGLSKTGTKSVASALTILGYKVHDVNEHFQYHLDEYLQALEGKHIPNFAAMYADVDAVTDLPACLFWKEIFDAFPDAKVVLMVRDSEEEWLQSQLKTIAVMSSSLSSSLWMKLGYICTPIGHKWGRCNIAIETKLNQGATVKVNESRNSDAARKRSYTEHNARVQSSIPRDQLLIYNVKQGWQPLLFSSIAIVLFYRIRITVYRSYDGRIEGQGSATIDQVCGRILTSKKGKGIWLGLYVNNNKNFRVYTPAPFCKLFNSSTNFSLSCFECGMIYWWYIHGG